MKCEAFSGSNAQRSARIGFAFDPLEDARGDGARFVRVERGERGGVGQFDWLAQDVLEAVPAAGEGESDGGPAGLDVVHLV